MCAYGITAKSGAKSVVTAAITYKDPSITTTSSQIYKWTVGGTIYTYTYDASGNITAISNGGKTTTYVYDSLDQLTRENNQAAGKTWVYTYDNGGNILTKKEYSYTTGTLGTALDTITYGYGDSSWKDLLTSYDGQALTSDTLGNLTNDGTWSYTWQHGRQLAQMSKPNGGGTENISFTYDAKGHRIAKERETTGSVDGNSYRYAFTAEYTYLDDMLTDMKWTEIDGSDSSFHFTYDAVGPMSMTFCGAEYFYLKNAQGDVTGLVDSSGTQVVAYTYDAWGNILSTTGSMADSLGYTNPLRYRGYFYDTETGLYYVSSRYYNPRIGRFINTDDVDLLGINGDFASLNLFAYCGNNPVSREDTNGECWISVGIMAVGGLIGAAISAVSSAVTQKALTGTVNWKSVGVAAATGFVSGAIAASPLGLAGQVIAGGVTGGLSYAADCLVNNKAMKLDEAIVSVGMGAISGRIGGSGANQKMALTSVAKNAKQTIARETRRANQKYARKVIAATVKSRKNTFAKTAWSSSFRFALGTGVSNGISGKYSSLGRYPNAPRWKFR